MNNVYESKDNALLTGEKIGFAAGVIFSVGVMIIAKMRKSDRYPFSNL